MKPFLITVPAGKRLLAKAVASLPQVKGALANHTIVIISGSTNGYIAEEILSEIGQGADFSKASFMRGINLGPGKKATAGNYSESDIVIEKGIWQQGKTIFDVASSLGQHDIILKGANAVDSERKLAGIQIGNPTLGTSAAILPAVVGKRTELIIPVGLEKRIFGNIGEIAAKLNDPASTGFRMLPISGTIITELEAITLLTGVSAELIAAGGIKGAEGSCWIGISGTEEQVAAAGEILRAIANEPPFAE
ncbi:MAG: hypothetical protein ACK5H4_13495 [Lacrimispora sphenoides]